jgi:hypothetical protein
MDPEWRQFNHLTVWNGKQIEVIKERGKALPDELINLFENEELKKYFTEKELAKGGS